jgi:uncharacterized RDD family membrane protein YckC
MDEEPNPPVKDVIPLPDLPPPEIQQPPPPPPSLGGAPDPPHEVPAAGVKVRIREGGSYAESVPEAGSIARFNTRIIAALIDVVVAAGLQMAALWILPGFAARIAWFVGMAYLITRDSLPFLGGQSVGKKAMKLKVVTLDEKSLSGNWEPALIRNGVLIIPFFALIELFILLTHEDKPERGRRLGDEWAKTKVIVAEDPPAAE